MSGQLFPNYTRKKHGERVMMRNVASGDVVYGVVEYGGIRLPPEAPRGMYELADLRRGSSESAFPSSSQAGSGGCVL